MSKLKSMKYQVCGILADKLITGTSKHELKNKAKNGDEEARRMLDETIFSFTTLRTYEKECTIFGQWCKDNFGVKYINGCKPLVSKYMEKCIEDGLSAWTIHLRASAICKLYGMSQKELHMPPLPSRKREDIKRSRNSQEVYSADKNTKEIITFAKATGLRKHEIAMVRYEDICVKNGKYHIFVKQGKGGKKRMAEIQSGTEDFICQLKSRGKPSDLIFPNVPKELSTHIYRAEYACAKYEEYARDVSDLPQSECYVCKKELKGTVYDKQAMAKVSKWLGHNRINVIATNYLYQLKQTQKGAGNYET